ncbi:MAG: glycoside hydrolase family 3 protein [Peptococcaceae bacterium]|nr:glycoside hydrolase family 3 protein [Peptococcaceae bacterium]
MKKEIFLAILLSITCLCLISGLIIFSELQSDRNPTPPTPSDNEDQAAQAPIDNIETSASTLDLETRKKAEDFVAGMSLEEKLYQMFFVTPESLTGVGTVIQAGETTKAALQTRPVGGLIYFSENIRARDQLQTMITKSQEYTKIPLFIGIDEEGGQVARLSGNPQLGYEKITPMRSIGDSGDSTKAHAVGQQLAKMLKDFGFNVDFAPVADIITNPNNTEIGNRSFGTDPNLVADMVGQEVKGLQGNGVSAVLKHFPGHGSTQTDSHNGYSGSSRTLEELRKTEFLPFQKGIEAEADFVLISHMSAINVDSSSGPSTLSSKIITDILINELKYDNIIITDSMSMGAITKRYTTGAATVAAVEAGVDMILMPLSLEEAYAGLQNAVKNGKISEKRIDESVQKIIYIKLKRGIMAVG